MVTDALIALISSFFFAVALIILVHKERRRSRRFFAAKLRGWLDDRVENTEKYLEKSWEHFSKYIVQLSWYYSIHSILKAILRMIVAIYTYFENVFEQNRNRTKQLRAEKRQLSEFNHLHHMTNHQKDTALTPSQQKKLRQKKLEEKH